MGGKTTSTGRIPRPDTITEGRVLLVSPDTRWLTSATVALENEGYRVHGAPTSAEAASVAAQLPVRLVVAHRMQPEEGRKLVGWLRSSAMRRQMTVVQLVDAALLPFDVRCWPGVDHCLQHRDLDDLTWMVRGYFHVSAPCPPLLPPQRMPRARASDSPWQRERSHSTRLTSR